MEKILQKQYQKLDRTRLLKVRSQILEIDRYCYGSLDTNSALYNFLGQAGISIHFFDYYDHYTGSFQPKKYLLAGKIQISQTSPYLNGDKRLKIARKFVEGAAFNITKNLDSI